MKLKTIFSSQDLLLQTSFSSLWRQLGVSTLNHLFCNPQQKPSKTPPCDSLLLVAEKSAQNVETKLSVYRLNLYLDSFIQENTSGGV